MLFFGRRVDCDEQKKYLQAVEESAQKADDDGKWMTAEIIRARGQTNVKDSNCE